MALLVSGKTAYEDQLIALRRILVSEKERMVVLAVKAMCGRSSVLMYATLVLSCPVLNSPYGCSCLDGGRDRVPVWRDVLEM